MNLKYFAVTGLLLTIAGYLAGCSVGASGDAPSTIFTGSVSAGAPLTDCTLVVTDSSTPAKTYTAPVLADGSYSIDTEGGVAPFLFQAHGKSGSREAEFFSASAARSGKVNISPLTSLVVATAAGQDCAVTVCTSSTFTAALLTAAAAKVQSQMVPLLTQFGLAIADEQDSKLSNPAKTKKWVFFKHIAVGGFVYSREGPLEFIKDSATGNWRMTGNPPAMTGAKAGKNTGMYAPLAGASSFGKWLPFSTDSSLYPDGAILIVVSSSSISPTITLVYTGGNSGAANTTRQEMGGAVSDVSFLPACPRPVGQAGSCIDVTQKSHSGEYSAVFNERQPRFAAEAIK